jgi:hypothetical protein
MKGLHTLSYPSRTRNASRRASVHPALRTHAARCLSTARRDPTQAAALLKRALNGSPLFRKAVIAALQS